MNRYYIYILTNNKRTLNYIGITSNLVKRLDEHKNQVVKGFTRKYNIDVLVYFEEYQDVNEALAREKQLKRWHKEWKWNLIKSQNPKLEEIEIS